MTTDSLAIEDPLEPALIDATQEETNARVAGATGILALGNIASRVLGLARETVLTGLFGATGAADAFLVAILIPKGLFDLLIAGHINSAIVPVLSEVVTKEGKTELWRLLSVLLSLVTTLLAILVLALEIFAPEVVRLVSSGSSEATLSLAADLLRLTAPALIFMGLFALFSGTLYALRSFTWPAFAGVVFNGSIVAIALLFAPPVQVLFTTSTADFGLLVARPASGITVFAVGWLIGALAQMALQLPGLRGARLRLRFNWRHPAVWQITVLYAPVMFSLIMDTLIIRPFSYNLASHTGTGDTAYMNWATTLMQFPQGLVATAISLAILPTLARQATLIEMQGSRAFKDTLGLGLRLTTTLILPATVGLFMLAVPIIDLIFEHGAFTAANTSITAMALRLYLIGLPFAAWDLLLVYAFYARQDTLTPALVGLLSLTVYMVIALALVDTFGLFSLMIADSAKHITHALVSAYLLRRRMDGFGSQRLIRTFLKTTSAVILMGLTVYLTLPLLTAITGTDGFIRETLLVVVSGAAYGGLFLMLAFIFRIDELRWLMGLVYRKLSPNNSSKIHP